MAPNSLLLGGWKRSIQVPKGKSIVQLTASAGV